jgi:hypothetical protein
MPPTSTRNFSRAAILAALLIAALLFTAHYRPETQSSSREQLLQFVPADSTAVIFLHLDEFRQSPFLASIYSWAPHPKEDSEYTQFVRDTGFSYERDLKAAVMAISNHGTTTSLLMVVDGRFDRKKIEAFLTRAGTSAQQGKLKVFSVNDAGAHEKPVSLAFLSDNRIAVTDAPSLAAQLASAASNASHAEWNSRFDRLAGTPLFVVVHQDPVIHKAFDSAAPGGFRSPQLSALLDQLQWISIAGKPDGEELRAIAEGECQSELASAQLRDMLQGILLLAQNGLHDRQLRQQMNADEREAYLEILQGAEVQKIDRGEWKTVRVALSITPKFLDLARIPYVGITKPDDAAPAEKSKRPAGKSASQKKN